VGDFAGARNMRTAAEVDERVVLIDRQRNGRGRPVAVLVDLAGHQVIDQFDLQRLPLEETARLVGRDLPVAEVVRSGQDLPHARFQPHQVLGGEGHSLALGIRAQVEVVVEARVDGRTDAQPRLRKLLQHRLGQDMRQAVPDPVQPVFGGNAVDHFESSFVQPHCAESAGAIAPATW